MRRGKERTKPLRAHLWELEQHGHYVDEHWCSRRLFEQEDFGSRSTLIYDPCCGWGRILQAAKRAGFRTVGGDVVNRNAKGADIFAVQDFLKLKPHPLGQRVALVCNPPFHLIEKFVTHALKFNADPVAAIMQVRRLPAARSWLEGTPLARVLFMTPRPSMPSGSHIKRGGKVGGGTEDYVWLIWRKNYRGDPTMGWLTRDRES